MAPSNHKTDPAGGIKKLSVIHRSKHDKEIGDEPSMQKLKEILDSGKVDTDRVHKYLEDGEKIARKRRRPMGRPPKHLETSRLTVRISPEMHQRLREIAEAKGESINDLLFRLIERYTKREYGKIHKAGKAKRGNES